MPVGSGNDSEIGFKANDQTATVGQAFRTNQLLHPDLPIESALQIEPKVETSSKLIILICKLKNGGFVTGGACAKNGAFDRALGELMRHYLAFAQNRDREPRDSYNRRLHYFARGTGNSEVERRLSQIGNKTVHLPQLEVDMTIDHEFSNFVYIHRCLFPNQAEFVDEHMNSFWL